MTPNLTLSLLRRELAGSPSRSLRALPTRFVERIDSDGVRERLARVGIGSLLLQLEGILQQSPTSQLHRAQLVDVRVLVSDCYSRLCETSNKRELFIACQGDVLIVRLLLRLAASIAEDGALRNLAVPALNECIQILAELAITDLQQAEAFASQHHLLATLFVLMGDRQVVDSALTLAQELLSVGPDVFPLSTVPHLPELISKLSPRGLSLMGRALAVLLAKSAEQTMDGVPAPECVPPDLCASCANNAALLAMPKLLERIVALLRLKSPPPGLWGHMLAQLHSAPGLMSGWPEETEVGWERLSETSVPQMVVMLSPQHVLQPLRELIAGADDATLEVAASEATATMLATDGPTPAPGQTPAQGATPHVVAGILPGSLQLPSLQTALWSTLQADLLYVLWALMGGKTKQEAQRQLVGLGLLPVIRSMLERLDWKTPAAHQHGQHGAGCSCSPQSCLQMQLLRTLQAICEKESESVSYHRLLLLTEREAPTLSAMSLHSSEPRHAQQKAATDDPCESTAVEGSRSHAEPSAFGAEDGDSLGIAPVAAADIDGHEDSKVGTTSTATMVAGGESYAAGPSSDAPSNPASAALTHIANSMTTPACAPEGSVLRQVLTLLLEQPPNSVYILGLASCVHKWVQASTPAEQMLVAAHPGLVTFVLDQLLSPDPPAEPTLQVFFDLLAELIKFNLPLLKRLQDELAGVAKSDTGDVGDLDASPSERPSRAHLFVSRLLEYPVDASIFMQCVALTLSPESSPLRGKVVLASLGLAPPHPICAAAAGMPPPPAGSPPRLGPLANAFEGCIARMVHERRVTITRSLISAVQVAQVSVETMCVINAAIIFFLLADLEGRRLELLDAVSGFSTASEEAPPWPSAPSTLSRGGAPLSAVARTALVNFDKLLAFWNEVYHSHSCERKFLEFSSGVPFPRWQALVAALKRDLKEKLETPASRETGSPQEVEMSSILEMPGPFTTAALQQRSTGWHSATECADGCACGGVTVGFGFSQVGDCA